MSVAEERHQDQIAYWNSSGGEKWAAAQEHTDRMLAPISNALLERASAAPWMSVLDIGCGCGATTYALGQIVGPAGRVVGVDVSRPMLALARSRLAGFPQVETLEADAASFAFPRHFADLAISRFGVMFFGDPSAAFKNIRAAIKPSGRIVFACWRPLEENPWMHVPLHAAYDSGVPRKARPAPGEPGPFAFGDPKRITQILLDAGFLVPDVSAANFSIDISAGGGLAGAVRQSMTIGPASAAMRDQPEDMRRAAADAIAKALEPYVRGERVELAAAIWLVESRTP